MTKVKLLKFRFKPGSKQIWLDWSKELERRKEEVIASMKKEGMISEACFISDDGEFVYYFVETNDFGKTQKSIEENPNPIDIEHKKSRESSLEFVGKQECLFHFNID